jgi:predicted lipoprotein with Yx(FWY)xxD motif
MKTLKLSYLIIIAAFTMVSVLTVSCSKSSSSDPNPEEQTNVTGVQLSQNTTFGSILTDNKARSLYFFSNDAATTSTCVDGCAVVWPVFYVENPSIGTGLAATDFGVITRADGSKQTTYKGWPLYYYKDDAKAGDTNGDAVGGIWFIAKADYSVMISNAQLIGHDDAQYNDQGIAGTGASKYLVDANGHTLYLFSRDTHDTNTFTRSDFSNDAIWPMDVVANVGSIPSTLDKSQFSTISVFGKTQLVYKGHPLYFFGQDNATRGNTKGVSFPTPGAAIWKVLNSTTPVL